MLASPAAFLFRQCSCRKGITSDALTATKHSRRHNNPRCWYGARFNIAWHSAIIKIPPTNKTRMLAVFSLWVHTILYRCLKITIHMNFTWLKFLFADRNILFLATINDHKKKRSRKHLRHYQTIFHNKAANRNFCKSVNDTKRHADKIATTLLAPLSPATHFAWNNA